MKLELLTPIQSKIQYFNNRFSSKEWSGPAWYRIVADDNGFPKSFILEHFHPLDLGHGTATEWEAKDLAKVLKKTYEEHPKLKSCFMGLIHSHHSMGAFFSGTDTSTLEEMAPDKGFYCSLVVATKKEPFAFAFAYKDQYGKAQVYEIDNDDIVSHHTEAAKDWIEIADKIEKNATPAHTNNYAVGYNGQLSLVGNGVHGAWNRGTYDIETAGEDECKKSTEYTKEECDIAEALIKDLEDGKLNWIEFQEQMEANKLDSYEYYDRIPDNYGGYNGYGHRY